MKSIVKIFYFSVAIALLAACGNDPEPQASPDSAENGSVETGEETDIAENEDEVETEQQDDSASEEASPDDEGNADSETIDSALGAYFSEQIEYARVWLQLGPNEDIDGLYVKKFRQAHH